VARLVRQAPGGVSAPIYLDYQATTPLAPEAAAAMRPWLEDRFANPHSAHRLGREASAVVEIAREQVTEALGQGAEEGRLFFTGGATEALNWALKGGVEASGRRKIVTVATEHAAVLDTAQWLYGQGCELVVLPVDRNGHLDWQSAAASIDAATAVVAIMLVNNEIGVIQSVAIHHLGRRAREVGAFVLCDAVQGFGKLPLPMQSFDLAAVSAHKMHGPKGIGALWARKGFEPAPLLHGGGQEGGLRSGTLSPALCAGFGAAAKLVVDQGASDGTHVAALAERLRAPFREAGWRVNGDRLRRWPGNLNIRHDNVDAARLISEVREVAFSAGSACASGSGRPSHVLKAIGLTDRQARGSIRLGFGRYTTAEEVDRAADLILAAARRQLGEGR
jgi:cysteine desulfurase